MTQTCPTSKDLRSVVDGSLSDIDSQAMELHIERCEACQHAIQEFAADGTFWKSAAKNLSDDRIVGPGLDRVIETLQHQSREEAEEIGEAIELKLSFIEPPVEPGTIGRLRHYDLLRVAGRGGMGIVLKAFDRSLRRIVAIKLLAPHLAGNGQARQRFIREGRAAAAVCHEHVVTIHAVEESPPFLVMQYVHGETLEARIHRNGSLDIREAVRIALQISQGLAAAHAQGVVHRDIKPANILLENGVARVRITDFGLARAIDDASLTQSGVVAGTPQYMAPEQANGDAIDERADLFSLGSVIYTMLAGHAPFRATTAMGVLKRLCDNAARPIREINPETPDWLVVLINRLHAKRPADRFHHAGEVAALLERGLAAMQAGTALPVPFSSSEDPTASGRASALRVSAMSAHSSPSETTAVQDLSAEVKSTARYAAVQDQSSNKVRDLRTVVKRLLPPYPRWLLFAVVGMMVTPFVPKAGILGGAFAVIALLAPRIFPRLTSKRQNGSASADSESGYDKANSAASTPRKSFIFMEMLRLLAWSLLWLFPIAVWTAAFFVLKFQALSGTSQMLFAANDDIIGMTAVILIAWLLIAFFWFRRKDTDGSPLFSSVVRRKGMLTVAGLAGILCACGYGTWYSHVYRHQLQQIAWANPGFKSMLIPEQQLFPVRIEFEGAQDGIDVIIDNGSDPVTWAPIGNSRQTSLPGRPGTFPWHARLGQNTFASGEVTLEAGKTAVIKVPGPKLIDLIAGRWKSDNTNLEFEFSKATAIIANRTPGATSRSDLTVQIDQSVTPALITLTDSSGEKLEGIIRFEPHAVDLGLQSGSMGIAPNAGMSSGGSMMAMGGDGSSLSVPMTDRLQICVSQGGSLRPWQFASDPDHGISLFELLRSEDPEPLRRSLVLEPLPNGTTKEVVTESVEAWSKHLNVPIERRNSIGLDLTLVPPTSIDLPPHVILQGRRLLLPEGTKVPDETPQHVPSSFTSPEPKPIVSYPFVISRDVITMAQFQQFVAQTGYITDAERGQPLAKEKSSSETPLSAESTQAAGSDVPVEERGATKPPTVGNIGGWLREDDKSILPTVSGWHRLNGRFIWHDGLNWKTPAPNSIDGSTFPTLPDSPLRVVMLSHNDATAFCQWLSTKENRQYRLPTALEWTASIQLGALPLPMDTENRDPPGNRTWFDASQPNPLGIRIATEVAGEWTSSIQWAKSEEVFVIVKKDITSDGKRFDLSHQMLAPPAFRSSEISFRVVAELQTLTTPANPFKQ